MKSPYCDWCYQVPESIDGDGCCGHPGCVRGVRGTFPLAALTCTLLGGAIFGAAVAVGVIFRFAERLDF